MHIVAPGVSIHTPQGGFDHFTQQQYSPNVEDQAPEIIKKIKADLCAIDESIASAREGMSDPEHSNTVRAHFKRLHSQFCEARRDLLAIKAQWYKTTKIAEHQFPDTWTEENTATLRRLFAEGKSATEIAKETGVTAGAVRHKVRRLKLIRPLPNHSDQRHPDQRSHENKSWWTELKVETLRRLFAEGKTPTQIGRELGCSRHIIRYKIKLLKLRKSQPEQQAQEAQLAAA